MGMGTALTQYEGKTTRQHRCCRGNRKGGIDVTVQSDSDEPGLLLPKILKLTNDILWK